MPLVVFGCFDGSFAGKNETVFIQEEVSTKLDKKSLVILNKYGNTIRYYSEKYGVDWRLVAAVITVESRFDHSAESHKGAKGFMQVMPATQDEIAEKFGLEREAFDDPHGNIRAGVYYLSQIYKQFGDDGLSEENRIKFTLASYNAGPGRIIDARKMAAYVNDDPKEWKSVKNSLPLLSKKYASLHRFVWEERKPSNGYFKGWKETANYVENVMGYYGEYRKVLDKNV
ncbi:MAG: transglycosylase SLT domain-containing protein [Bacteroidetes bacterium]|nr:transglycosylase SLT domain-containing protein [Bacteroidota bacterium]